MATCIQCQGSKKPRVFIAEQYCDVCGFGFLPEPENKGRTCRDPKRVFKGAPAIVKEEVEEAHEEEVAEPVPAKETIQTVEVVSGSVQERVLEAIKAHPLIGKKEIMAYAKVSEGEYTEAKDALLAANRIIQEGERRGAKYKALP